MLTNKNFLNRKLDHAYFGHGGRLLMAKQIILPSNRENGGSYKNS